MSEDLLVKLKAIDPSILADIVRQDQRSTSFRITKWSVKRLSDKGIRNPDGLWLFSRVGKDGQRSRPWSVVLKIIQPPDQELPPTALDHWKREALAIQIERFTQ